MFLNRQWKLSEGKTGGNSRMMSSGESFNTVLSHFLAFGRAISHVISYSI